MAVLVKYDLPTLPIIHSKRVKLAVATSLRWVECFFVPLNFLSCIMSPTIIARRGDGAEVAKMHSGFECYPLDVENGNYGNFCEQIIQQ